MTQCLTRRLLLASAAGVLASPAFAQQRRARGPAPLSAADQALVNKAIAYLQGLERAKGRFTQTDARGKTAGGDFYLARPGKARFVYDAPNQLLMVSDGNQVAVVDRRLKTYDAYPLRATPLALFLAKEIRLDKGVIVSSVTRSADGFSITASDRTNETKGAITLTFSDNPMALREWTVTDVQRGKTRVVLNNLARVGSLERSLFVLPKNTYARTGGSKPR